LDRASPLEHRGLHGREEARGGANLVGRHPRDRLGPFRRVLVDVLGELLEAVRVLLAEVVIVEVFLDDHVQEREPERVVGAGANLQPDLRLLRDDRLARIDRDHARLVQQCLADVESCLAVGARVRRLVPPVHDHRRRRAAREIADGQIAHRLDAGVHARMEALREPGLTPVRRAERVTETRYPADVMAARARAHRDRLGPRLRADLEDLLRDLVERLVPRDALPLAGALRPDAPLRILQAVGVIDELRRRRADRTEVSVIQRAFGIALDLRQLAVLDMHERAATAVAAAADALQDLDVARYLFLYSAHDHSPETVCIDFRELSRSSQTPRFAPAVAELALPP